MLMLATQEFSTRAAQILIAAFLAVLFLQSGVDKIIDRRGNLDWLTGHFAKSALANFVGLLLSVLTLLELASGILSAIGCVLLIVTASSTVAFFGALASAITMLALFFGQRVAKEYAGAATLVPYFILALLGMWVLG
ncbi:MAG: DoxX family protein [Verrucomicrobiota bacterium]|nr:DoxX family protein [Verrucomicrobiota bacterium]